MQMFNKNLEELNNKQSTMNTTITEIRNTLEVTNSRITEVTQLLKPGAKERASETEDKMVEITEALHSKET